MAEPTPDNQKALAAMRDFGAAMRDFVAARAVSVKIRSIRAHVGRCEFEEPAGDYESGDNGRAPCHRLVVNTDEWCDACAARDVLWPALRAAKQEERRQRARLYRMAGRIWRREDPPR